MLRNRRGQTFHPVTESIREVCDLRGYSPTAMAASTLSATVVHSCFVCYYYTKAPTLFAMKISGSHIENLFAFVWARVRLWGWPSLITLNGTKRLNKSWR